MVRKKTIAAFEEEFANDPAQWERFFDLIRQGVWVSDACNQLKRPYTLIWATLKARPELMEKYREACESVSHSDVSEVKKIADETPRDMVHVADKKVRIDTRFRRAALYDREAFGERVDHKHTGALPRLVIEVAMAPAIAERVVAEIPAARLAEIADRETVE